MLVLLPSDMVELTILRALSVIKVLLNTILNVLIA